MVQFRAEITSPTSCLCPGCFSLHLLGLSSELRDDACAGLSSGGPLCFPFSYSVQNTARMTPLEEIPLTVVSGPLTYDATALTPADCEFLVADAKPCCSEA